jgi:hypothetical protein
LQVRLIEQYVKTKKAVLAQAMRAADEKQIEELLEEAKAYDNLLNAHK